MGCKKLTLKQREFAKESVKTKNSTEAAMLSYACKNRMSAANIANKLHKNPKVKAEIERLLVEEDLTENVVVKRLREGLDAKATASHEGEVYQSDIPDLTTRLNYAKEAAKIMDLYPPTRTESRTVNIDLELDKMTPKQLEAFAASFFNSIKPKYANQTRLSDPVSSGENSEEDKGEK